MAETTGIDWADATFNSWWGCERVSPGCSRCYADTWARKSGFAVWDSKQDGVGPGEHAFRFFPDAHWEGPRRWARNMPQRLGRRPRVFCASMADVFEERPELEQERRKLFDLIEETPELDWLILTKRPEFARRWLKDFYESYWVRKGEDARLKADSEMELQIAPESDGVFGYREWSKRDGIEWGVLPNVWMGVSVENARFAWRADVLRDIPSVVRFISAEPLLGTLLMPDEEMFWGIPERTYDRHVFVCDKGHVSKRVLLSEALGRDACLSCREPVRLTPKPLRLEGIEWVIAGGESGNGYRPVDLDHLRELRDACESEGVAFFLKQIGGQRPKSNGKTLDGVEFCEFPNGAAVVA